MEVQTHVWNWLLEFLLDFVYLVQLFLVAPWDRESEVGCLVRLIAEHVLEFHGELIILVEKEVNLREDPSPLLLSIGQHLEHGLEALAV